MTGAERRSRHRVNTPAIAHEVVDGEVVIINLVSGDYYSCLGPAADVWQALAAGATAEEVARAVSEAYDVGDADVGADVEAFLGALVSDDLLVPTEGSGSPSSLPAAAGGGTYVRPAFEKFSDMADLIILDPVHDVSGQGWPHAPGTA